MLNTVKTLHYGRYPFYSRIGYRGGVLPYLFKIMICKRQKKWQPCCTPNSMLNSNLEVIFQEQRLDCAINMVKKLPAGKLEPFRNDFRGGCSLTVALYLGRFCPNYLPSGPWTKISINMAQLLKKFKM